MKERFILKNKTNVFCRVKSLFGVVLLLTIFYSNYSSAQNLKDITLDREWNKRIIPVYDYVVVFSLPKDWPHNIAYEKFDTNFYISEFIPKNQRLDEWTDMMTVTGYKKIDSSPKQYFSSLYTITQKICGEKATAAQIIREQDNFIIALLMCGSPLNDEIGKSINLRHDQGEMTLYKIFKDNESIYSIFYSWRGKKYDVKDEDDKNLPTTMDKVKQYIIQTKSIKICSKNNPTEECKEYVGLAKKVNKN